MKVLPAQPVDQARANRTINHALTVVSGLYDYLWRIDDVSDRLTEKTTIYLPSGARRYKDFNHLFLKLRGTHKGDPITYDEVNSLFRRLRSKTGIDVAPHILRHSSLSALAKAGWKPEYLQERAGHASFQHTYQLYVHVSENELHEEWEKTQQTVRMVPPTISVVSLA